MSIFNSKQSLSAFLAPVAIVAAAGFGTSAAQAATITEATVQNYAAVMKQAANSQNINQVSNLVADEALISLSRRGKTTSLDKPAYLKLLQDSWSGANNYSYDISISNVVISGDQAKADVRTTESWLKGGRQTTITTSSRATLKADTNNAILLRAVAQVTIE